MATAREPIDHELLVHSLRQSGDHDRLADKACIAVVIQNVPAPSHAAHYAGIVLDCAERRLNIRAAIELIRSAHDPSIPIDQSRRDARELLGPANGKPYNIGGPIMACLSDVVPVAIQWLWPGRIAIGKTTLIAGDPGLGKSLISLDIATRVSRGAPWPDSLQEPNTSGSVVLLTAEDDPADTIRPRLDAAGADPSKIHVLQAVEWYDADAKQKVARSFSLERDVPALEQAVLMVKDCRLVIIDPISAYLGKIDSHKNFDVRAVLAPLAELAQRLRVAVVAVSHLNKAGGPAMYRTMGSLAFVAAARAAWGVVKDKQGPTRRLMVPIKNNLAADTAGGMAYTIMVSDSNVPYLAWEPEPIQVTADEVMTTNPAAGGGQRTDAKAWLRDLLADGPAEASTIAERAHAEGIADRTLHRAKKELGVQSDREGFGPGSRSYWKLPDSVGEEPLEGHTLP